ncbi:putative secreted protein (IPTL-CTERM system target) [Acidovorax sp. 56]|uniref:IPTL-CTERM sorting domain-containing protein n=1 Tax=Acidovorax sp. 56 TaxID=2035205 RepID=UPI000C5D6F03|nr:IPTL-CTERM sorting domain-containing protein [Acidovorax sp. 56]PIF28651.1 putative secreted protein (IPTL-CTERM system target) [Acidovorax sp. 56]
MPPTQRSTRLGRSWLTLKALALGLTLSAGAHAATVWTNGQAAILVLGADNFTTAGATASASRFVGPTDICTDAATGKVFVIVYGQNRILRFSAEQAVTNGGAAEAVFGQPDFTSTTANNGGLSAKSLQRPMTCAMDAAGRLFVTDHGNRRVLRYDNAATKPSFAAADGMLGQADFTSFSSGTTANRFGASNLYGIALGPNGALYVSDPGNRRVLRFDNAAAKANGADADGVLGAANLTTAGAGGITASTFSSNIYGLTVDAAGNLYVSDASHRRILRFNNAAAKANGAAADGVLGAPDFTIAGAGSASSSTISSSVYGIDVLADGALYAADFGNHRVLIYNNPATKANGAPADHVLGQSNFTDSTAALTATGLNSPLGLGYNAQAGYLMIPDYLNNRVVGHYQSTLLANAAPVASSVAVSGTPQVGQLLTGSYVYSDADSDPQGASTFVWKRGSTPIGGATSAQYTPVLADVGQTLTFCVTPVASAGTAAGALACSAPTTAVAAAPIDGACGASAGQSLSVAPTANLCSAGTPGAVSSASGAYTWQCQGANGGASNSCQAQWANAGGGRGTVVLQPLNLWQVDSASFSATPPAAAPQGMTFPTGLLSLNLSSGTAGSDATVVVHFNSPVPTGAVYMKYGPSPDGYNCQGAACAQPHWYELPASRAVLAPDRLSATLTLTDGGLGDHDSIANQFIQDPGGFALAAAPSSLQGIPTLGEWGLLLLSALVAAVGMRGVRRRMA